MSRFIKNSVQVKHLSGWILTGLVVTMGGNLPSGANPAIAPTENRATEENGITRIRRATLNLGSQGTEVSELQAALKLLGYYTGPVSGSYDGDTAAAVARFQETIGAIADGVVGPDTWNRLFPAFSAIAVTTATEAETSTPSANDPTSISSVIHAEAIAPVPTPANPPEILPSSQPSPEPQLPVLHRGMREPAVTMLQQRLRALGFFEGAVDGIFGSETEAAVKAAQKRYNLRADGVVGPETWNAIGQ